MSNFPPDDQGYYTHHCDRCSRIVRSKARGAIGNRCRHCEGVILPGTATQWDLHLQARKPAKRLNHP